MRLPRVQTTVRRAMIAVAVVSIGFWAADMRRRPESHVVTLDGPFPMGRPIPLEVPGCSFLALKKVEMEQVGHHGGIAVQFEFRGMKDPRRVIDLEVVVQDGSGRVIYSGRQTATDPRIWGGKAVRMPSAFMYLPTVNAVGFSVNDRDLMRATRVTLNFQIREK